jgi:hypothetical protein
MYQIDLHVVWFKNRLPRERMVLFPFVDLHIPISSSIVWTDRQVGHVARH